MSPAPIFPDEVLNTQQAHFCLKIFALQLAFVVYHCILQLGDRTARLSDQWGSSSTDQHHVLWGGAPQFR